MLGSRVVRCCCRDRGISHERVEGVDRELREQRKGIIRGGRERESREKR